MVLGPGQTTGRVGAGISKRERLGEAWLCVCLSGQWEGCFSAAALGSGDRAGKPLAGRVRRIALAGFHGVKHDYGAGTNESRPDQSGETRMSPDRLRLQSRRELLMGAILYTEEQIQELSSESSGFLDWATRELAFVDALLRQDALLQEVANLRFSAGRGQAVALASAGGR